VKEIKLYKCGKCGYISETPWAHERPGSDKHCPACGAGKKGPYTSKWLPRGEGKR